MNTDSIFWVMLVSSVMWVFLGCAWAQTTLPKTIKVPYPPGEENVYPVHVYREAGAERAPDVGRVLRLAYTTPHLDDTVEGAKTYKTWYQISTDGGKTFDELRPLIQRGAGYDRFRPIAPVRVPKNSYVPSIPPPSRASNGEIMVPFYLWPLDDKGEHYNPVGGMTFTDAGVLIGKWTDDGKDIVWDLGQTVRLEGDRSTRGAVEPAIIETTPGRFLMILRGSNDARPHLPGYKWKCVSEDFCRTWSAVTPLTYSDGGNFFSPSACSDIRRHSKNGKVYWIGNICPENPRGNSPRYPLVIARVDETSCGLIRETVKVIDTRDPDKDGPDVQFSNFKVAEDPATGAFIVTLARFDVSKVPPGETWRTFKFPRLRYEVAPPSP